jgi:K+-transporting ATPase ATPase A chain
VRTIGNFWVDVTRSTLYVLLPICVVYTLFLVWQGIRRRWVPMSMPPRWEGAKQTIAVGPVASQVAIKMLGTNGGGFFNANAAHPFENPTALSNFVQMLSIFAIGAALTNVFGRMVGDQRQGWAILAVMGVLFIAGVAVTYWAEANGTPGLSVLGLSGGNMEGKEVASASSASALFAVITTAASCGAVNAMHDSFTALGGMIPLINMQLGEIIVGGVGAGLYGMLLFVVLAIFVAGLMVGRTPEYVGKKIRGARGQDGDARDPGAAADVSRLDRGRRRAFRRPSPRWPMPARTALPSAVRLHLGDRQQRLGLRRPHRQHLRSTTSRWPVRCSSAASS